ncbi:hypothetical protein SAMN06265375_10327 [Muriicola jejuensis]|uniref:Uncharacterized protein n=1 Tax=Muriicola jejuensis TaxID=504488 RepID=A0A6P0UKM1_9FLAO|nr:hypothetical protein [Muriicola jejuensis]NER11603.1 hypothetical protein [Muriicola jejuensis]SMP19332.1 hypothetical protein SAMN06265375_10327 [Muriicola jejuensis]
MRRSNLLLLLALFLGLAFHGSALFFTLESTYDALIHLFFADHYASQWWEPWDYRWYTGFTVMGYPPLAHQMMALFSFLGGLKFGLYSIALAAIVLFITGVYRFGLMLTGNRKVAGYTALLAVVSSTFIETLHLFGQLPSIIGISVLLHTLPEIYEWLRTGKVIKLVLAYSLIAVTVTSHHVTPIFGMVFFIFPLIGMAVMDDARDRVRNFRQITFKVFLNSFRRLFWRMVTFGMGSLALIVLCILPYWINSKENPITQVPIPHGSRDNFLEVTSSGLVFFLIPWGILLFLLPYIFYRFYSKRYLFFGLSFSMLTLLGTGGTTPLPRLLLGETAFNILTLDRFTLWATIMALPIFGEFMCRLVEGDLRDWLQSRFGSVSHRLLGGFLGGGILFMVVFSMSLGYFRPSQPQKINMLPIVNFLNQDMHNHWRYLTLGFGDQMAWLSAQTAAMTVDGNYHSARRLPELTTKAIERLENSKFRGVEGIGSLQQFLSIPEKYNLKYIFSNDKFYDPILYFCGWQRLQQLENGIMVWERLNVPPLPAIIPRDDVPRYLKLMWGIIPVLTVLIAFLLNIRLIWARVLKLKPQEEPAYLQSGVELKGFNPAIIKLNTAWAVLVLLLLCYGGYSLYLVNSAQRSPENVVKAYYDALDFKEFERAHSYLSPTRGVSLDQYMLEVAVTDGILSSYAKLDSIGVDLVSSSPNTATARIRSVWITPLETIKKTERRQVVKEEGNWYLVPEPPKRDIPSDQLFTSNVTRYYNHGRRKVTTQQTYHEDVLEQPLLEVLTARLVRNKDQYAIVGEIQNIDRVPADVTISATLYNEMDIPLSSYNAKYHIKHKLMPKEVTSFRIDFEKISWRTKDDIMPATFNPEQFDPVQLEEMPVKFNLQCAANIATTDLYKDVALQQLQLNQETIRGALFNAGVQEVTIPQILISYYDTKKELLWVDQTFVQEGIRVQRLQYFDHPFPELEVVEIISRDMKNCFVNGLPNSEISEKMFPDGRKEKGKPYLQPVSHKEFDYIKIETDHFIGNPRS